MTNNNANKASDLPDNKLEKKGTVGISTYVGTWIIVAVAAVVAFILYYAIIRPAEAATSGQAPLKPITSISIPVEIIFTVLFLMLGPFKIIGPFAKIAEGADALLTIKIALRATFVSALALLIAAFLGQTFLSNFGIPLPILGIAGGLILLLVALIFIVQQFNPGIVRNEKADAPTMKLAMAFAFPTIVTPYGIAALILFLALSPDDKSRLVISVIVLTIMLVNLISMVLIKYVFRFLFVFLQILAAVLGIIQVALGCQVINKSLRELLK